MGWDDNFPKENFATKAPGNGAFLIRNSWTESGRGEDNSFSGYFWMSYYEATINPNFYAVNAVSSKNYDNNYQYDAYTSYRTYVKAGANVYTAHAKGGEKGELIKAVSFYTKATNTKYKIDIYKDVKSSPDTGTLVSSASVEGTVRNAGFHTIKLTKPVYVKTGSKFAAMVSLGSNTLVCEYNQKGDEYQAASKRGQSYDYSENTKMFTDRETYGNIKIKVFTDNAESEQDDPPVEDEPPVEEPIIEEPVVEEPDVRDEETEDIPVISEIRYEIGEKAYTQGSKTDLVKSYTGSGIRFNDEIRVYHGDTLLAEKKDYTVSYGNNKALGSADGSKAPTILIKGKGNYAKTARFTFTISRADISKASVSSQKTVTLAAHKSARLSAVNPTVVFEGKTLKKDVDYTVEYYKAGTRVATPSKEYLSKAGETYTIRISAAEGGNFVGRMSETVLVKVVDPKTTVSVNRLAVTDSKGKDIKVPYSASGISLQTLFDNRYGDAAAVVRHGKNVLTYGTDYIVEATEKEYRSAGVHKFVIKGVEKADAKYVGEKTVSLTIEGTPISKARIEGLSASVDYTGKEITLAELGDMRLFYNDPISRQKVALKKDKDYTVSMDNTGAAGRFKLYITGMNAYSGSLSKTITVKPYNLAANVGNRVSVKVSDVVYTKAGVVSDATVTFYNGSRNVTLREGVDYTIDYRTNSRAADKNAANAPIAAVRGIGNFTGISYTPFTIKKADVSNISVSVKDVIYNSKANFKPQFKLTEGGKEVIAGPDRDIEAISEEDYKYTYASKTRMSDGSYKAAGAEVLPTDKPASGAVIKVSVNVSCSEASSFYSNGRTTLTGYYKVIESARDIARAKVQVLNQDELCYNNGNQVILGKENLNITIVIDGAKVRLGSSDYAITEIKNNRLLGIARVTLKGKGQYGGTKSFNFKIKPAGFE